MNQDAPRQIRRPSFCQTSARDSGVGAAVVVNRPRENVWNPNKADAHNRGSSGRRSGNLIDRRSLYAIKRENIASQDLHFNNRLPAQKGDAKNVNIEHEMERKYIHSSRLVDATNEKFPRVIMKHFYKASGPQKTPGYGMPRPETAEENQFKLLLDDLQREPSIVNIESFPALQAPVSCERVNEFCEILGPSSCSECIERTNRHIGDELQHIMFPMIEMSTERLILPKLAKVMKDGHRLQVKKRRMYELGIDLPHDLLVLKRAETPLSASTCLKSKNSHQSSSSIMFISSAKKIRKKKQLKENAK